MTPLRPIKLAESYRPYPSRGLGMEHNGSTYGFLSGDLCWDPLHRIFYAGVWGAIRRHLGE